jgi:1-acyl-sn-glycerol-3-phosphate acyltransferase
MTKPLNYIWRLFATGLSFSVFGIGGFMLWVFFFPLLGLVPGNTEQKTHRAQYCVHLSFFFFIGLMHRLGIMDYHIEGLDKLNRPGQLIIANHPTLVDIVFLISRIPHATCIVKESLWHNPFMRGPIINAGYISNGNSEQMIQHCVNRLQKGGVVIIFPEGTRSVEKMPYKFQRGAARIALKANCLLTPVTLSCQPPTLSKQDKWYHIPDRKFHLGMSVGNDIVLEKFTQIKPESIAVRRLTRYLQDYFTHQRELHEHLEK